MRVRARLRIDLEAAAERGDGFLVSGRLGTIGLGGAGVFGGVIVGGVGTLGTTGLAPPPSDESGSEGGPLSGAVAAPSLGGDAGPDAPVLPEFDAPPVDVSGETSCVETGWGSSPPGGSGVARSVDSSAPAAPAEDSPGDSLPEAVRINAGATPPAPPRAASERSAIPLCA